MTSRCRAFQAFGLSVESTFPLPGVSSAAPAGAPHVTIDHGDEGELLDRWSGDGAVLWETVLGDGVALRYEVGGAGDARVTYGGSAFHVRAGADSILCASSDESPFAWQRQLLDTVLFCVSFARGYELLHAAAVATPTGAAAFVGPTGAGKSSLVAELVRRGHRLLSDDVLAISPVGREIASFPGPAVMNLPAARAEASGLGAEIICRFAEEDELWVVIPSAATDPLPLSHLFLLGRTEERGVTAAVDATVLDVAPHAIALPDGPERARRRFGVLSSLVGQAAIWHLNRGSDGPPGFLADEVERVLGQARPSTP